MTGQPVHGHRHRHRGPARAQFLEYLQVDLVRLAAAAEALRVGQAEQARLAERGEQPFGIGRRAFVLIGPGGQFLVGDLDGEGEEVLGVPVWQEAVHRHGGS